MSDSKRIHQVYGDGSLTFEFLRRFGWGPMLNLGWHSWPGALAPLNLVLSRGLFAPRFFLLRAQERLLSRSIGLLAPRPGDSILDVACGRGRSSFVLAAMHPGARVTGIDIDPASIAIAKTLHGASGLPRPDGSILEFRAGDALNLAFADGSVDRVLALECAFHFSDRMRFLAECRRVLRPGGRLVIVDFAWQVRPSASDLEHPLLEFLRGEWAFDDLWSRAEYETGLSDHGFHFRVHDWSSHVSRALSAIFGVVARLGSHRLGRKVLCTLNPLLASLRSEDWHALGHSARAHGHAAARTSYLALLAEAPS